MFQKIIYFTLFIKYNITFFSTANFADNTKRSTFVKCDTTPEDK